MTRDIFMFSKPQETSQAISLTTYVGPWSRTEVCLKTRPLRPLKLISGNHFSSGKF